MPSFKQTVAGIAVSTVIVIGGAYMAYEMPSISEYVVSYDSSSSNAATVSEIVRETPEFGDVATNPVSGSDLSFTIHGIERSYGKVIVMVYGDEDSYRNYDPNGLLAYEELSINSGTVTVSFENIGEGPFAITFFQDEDGNGDLTLQGEYPIEGYGGSGMKTPYSEPSFEKASVGLGSHNFKMHYLK
ncbi:DUF2141 domain-containing protein [Curvivirga aplysinae]|uniref:DUF2141 domain-containing protein n=1 Tax=Curvivirga aplysinae TaxID=2529852 RepID=UPI0012BB623F|nr:DUF2141 domain-containing protein [Curvivirga aplysinae]MTI08380.1 DUF2141 domain-containing protein [Curvivirga aplysinae]